MSKYKRYGRDDRDGRDDRGGDRDDDCDDRDNGRTIRGTNGNDLLTGTAGIDSIYGGNGNDTINAGAGNDYVDAGSGNDVVDGGAGNDRIFAGSGNDQVLGGSGNDNIDAGSGDDVVTGGAGNDQIEGGSGIDVAVYSGRFSDYKLTLSRDGGHCGDDDDDRSAMTVHDLRSGSPDGVDVLKNVEVLRFSDGEYRGGRFYPNGGGNSAPVALGDTAVAVEDTVLSIPVANLLGNDSDANGDTLTITSVQGAVNGTVALSGGSVIFTPASNFSGPASFTYTISDGRGGFSTATVNVNVAAVNDAPVARGDTVAAVEDTALAIPMSSLLSNDSDVDGNALTIVSVQGATNGTVGIVAGNVVFTPAANYNGPASFTYTISDGQGGTSTATVNVNVAAVNDAPVARGDTVAAVEDTALAIPMSSLLSNDSDVDGNALTIVSVQGAANGTVGIVAGNVVFTPAANYNGPASFTYTISDGQGGTSTATVNVNVAAVNDAPVAQGDTVAAVEDTALAIPMSSLLSNDSDVDGNALTIVSVQGATNGTVGIVAGNVVFTPAANYNGPASFTYTISDGQGGTSTATVNVNVAAVNDAPELTGVPEVLADGAEGVAYTVSAASLLAGYTDVDGDSLSIVGLSADFGTVVDNGDGSYTITPDPGYTGPVHLSYSVVDGNGGVAEATQSFLIAEANLPPEFTGVQVALAAGLEDSPYTLSTANLVAGFSDPNGDSLSVSNLVASNGNVVDNGDGTYTIVPVANYNGPIYLSYQVVDGRGGSIAATQQFELNPLNDAPVVTGPDPVAVIAEGGNAVELDLLAGATDIDVGDVVSVGAIDALPPGVTLSGNFLTIDPSVEDYDSLAVGESRTFVVGYDVVDLAGAATHRTATITVTGTNDSPIAIGDVAEVQEDGALVASGNVLGNDLDVDGDDLVVTTAGTFDGRYGSLYLNADGTYQYTLNNESPLIQALIQGQTVRETFDYEISDGSLPSISQLVIDVVGENDAPTIAAGVITISAFEGQAAFSRNLLNGAFDSDEDAILNVVNVSGLGPGMEVVGNTLIIDPSNPAFDYLRAGETVDFSFDYQVADQHGAVADGLVGIKLVVTGVNDAPRANLDRFQLGEDQTLQVDAGQLTDNDTDPESDPLSVFSVGAAVNGSVQLDSAGQIVFVPNQNFSGLASFEYILADGVGGQSTGRVEIDVAAVADAPTLSGVDSTGFPGVPIPLVISASVVDPSESIQEVRIGGLPEGAVLNKGIAQPDGSWLLTASQLAGLSVVVPPDFLGVFALHVTAVSVEPSNGSAESTSRDILVSVTPATVGLNVTPDFAQVYVDSQIDPDHAVSGNVLASGDFDSTPGAVMSVDPLVATTSYGTLTVDAAGNFSYDVDVESAEVVALGAGEYFDDVFAIRVRDQYASVGTTLTVRVHGVNDAPVAVNDSATIDEDMAGQAIVLLGNDWDPDLDTLTIQSAYSNLLGTSLQVSGDGIFYSPGSVFDYLAEGQIVNDSVTYTVADPSGATSTGTLTVQISGVNDSPIATSISADIAAGRELAGRLPFVDPDLGDQLTFMVNGMAVGPDGLEISLAFGTVIVYADGNYAYTAGSDFGVDSITFTVDDGYQVSGAGSLVFNVVAGLPPLFADDPVTGDAVNFNDFSVVAGSYDPDTQYASLAGDDVVVLPFNQMIADAYGYDLGRSFSAGDGNDHITGGFLDDNISLDDGDDVVVGSGGSDLLFGGEGSDTVSYEAMLDPVQVFLSLGVTAGATQKGAGLGNDTLFEIENVVGSEFDDSISGSDGANELDGFLGDDVISGGAGVDELTGGEGADTFEFGANETGVDNADLITDFNVGDGDRLDIRDLLIGYSPDAANEFVQLFQRGDDAVLAVDRDGAAGGASFESVVQLLGVSVDSLSDGGVATDQLLDGVMAPSFNLASYLIDNGTIVATA